jgi:hypothetical protein
MSFSTPAEAITALKQVEDDYDAHQRAAVNLATSVFSADRVLKEMLSQIP